MLEFRGSQVILPPDHNLKSSRAESLQLGIPLLQTGRELSTAVVQLQADVTVVLNSAKKRSCATLSDKVGNQLQGLPGVSSK